MATVGMGPILRDAQLSRIQRALGLKERVPRKGEEGGYECVHQYDFDPRTTIQYPFERDVLFVSMSVNTNSLSDFPLGVAILDTANVRGLAPGLYGKNFIDKISCNTISEGGMSRGKLRQMVAQCFEASPPCHRKTILVSRDAARLQEVLVKIGFDPKLHSGVIDIVDINTVAMAFRARQNLYSGDELDQNLNATRSGGFCDIPFSTIATGLGIRIDLDPPGEAKAVLEAMIKYGLLDMQKCSANVRLPGGAGGDFPGPFLKLETDHEKLAASIRRALSIKTEAPMREVEERTMDIVSQAFKLRSKVSMSVIMLDMREGLGNGRIQAGILPEQMIAKIEALRSVSGYENRPMPPKESGPMSAKQYDKLLTRYALDATIKKDIPRSVRDACLAYDHAGRAFAEQLLEAVKSFCDVTPFLKSFIREYRLPFYLQDDEQRSSPACYSTTERLDIIWPPQHYVTLAKLLRDKAPSKVGIKMIETLKKEIIARKLVDDWVGRLPDKVPEKDVAKAKSHEDLKHILCETLDILSKTLRAEIQELGRRLDQVEWGVKELTW